MEKLTHSVVRMSFSDINIDSIISLPIWKLKTDNWNLKSRFHYKCKSSVNILEFIRSFEYISHKDFHLENSQFFRQIENQQNAKISKANKNRMGNQLESQMSTVNVENSFLSGIPMSSTFQLIRTAHDDAQYNMMTMMMMMITMNMMMNKLYGKLQLLLLEILQWEHHNFGDQAKKPLTELWAFYAFKIYVWVYCCYCYLLLQLL